MRFILVMRAYYMFLINPMRVKVKHAIISQGYVNKIANEAVLPFWRRYGMSTPKSPLSFRKWKSSHYLSSSSNITPIFLYTTNGHPLQNTNAVFYVCFFFLRCYYGLQQPVIKRNSYGHWSVGCILSSAIFLGSDWTKILFPLLHQSVHEVFRYFFFCFFFRSTPKIFFWEVISLR